MLRLDHLDREMPVVDGQAGVSVTDNLVNRTKLVLARGMVYLLGEERDRGRCIVEIPQHGQRAACCNGSGGVAASVSAAPAQAEYSIYSCESCASKNGPEVYVPEAMKSIGVVEGAKGVCAAAWENLGEGKWKEYLKCTASESETWTATGFVGPFYGHGQVRRYYKEYLYDLWGEEQWI